MDAYESIKWATPAISGRKV